MHKYSGVERRRDTRGLVRQNGVQWKTADVGRLSEEHLWLDVDWNSGRSICFSECSTKQTGPVSSRVESFKLNQIKSNLFFSSRK